MTGKVKISFRLASRKVRDLDAMAETMNRDRSYLLNEAVEAYLDVQQWQIEQIKASIRQADEGKLIEHKQVRKMATKWRLRVR